MYFVTTTADTLDAGRPSVIEKIVGGVDVEIPFGRYELCGPGTLGYYMTQQRFVARNVLAVFPSKDRAHPADIVTGSFCDWRASELGRLGRLAYGLTLRQFQNLETIVSEERLENFYFAQRMGILPETIDDDMAALEATCTAKDWPSAILALETVENDRPENPKPELATMYAPLFGGPLLGYYSLQEALRQHE